MGDANSMLILGGLRGCWKLSLVSSLVLGGSIAFSGNYALGQVVGDNTLGADSSQVTSPTAGEFLIEGGTPKGKNLFHSFSQFSIPTNGSAYFNNAGNIQNIISRVTGGSVSNIDGLIKANGRANLFLINPNGIIFGSNASVDIGGSFVASTASSLIFADGTQFNATAAQTTPLLTVSVPIGLQFGGNPGSIEVQGPSQPTNISLNSSSLRTKQGALAFAEETQAILMNRSIGLQVPPSKTLALVGGDVVLQGGSLTTRGGRIELGSVAGSSLVSLTPTNKGWTLGYEGVQHFQNIQMSSAATVNASGAGGGDVQIQGGQVTLSNQSLIAAITLGNRDPGEVSIRADQLTVEKDSVVGTGTLGTGKSGNVSIEAENLMIRGSIVESGTASFGNAGDLKIQARASVNVVQQGFILTGALKGSGNGGNLILDTGQLIIQDGSVVNTGTFSSGHGGNLVVQARESVEVSGTNINGEASLLTAETGGAGKAGDLTITTGQLNVRDRGIVSVVSEGSGEAGRLSVAAHSIQLDNGRIRATTTEGNGGNITLQAQDLLLMQHGSVISATAGTSQAGGDGGNIAIDTGFIVAVRQENSDITANAFTGRGGNINITTQGIYGLEFRPRLTPLSDITASSEFGVNGTVQINTPDVDPSRGLTELPVEPVNVEVTQGCQTQGKQTSVAFFNTGRGGLAPNPYEPISSSDIWEDVPPSTQRAENSASAASASASPATPPDKLVEAQGWIVNEKGQVTLVAEMPATHPQIRCRLR